MADEEKLEQPQEGVVEKTPESKGGFNKKVIVIGVPLFIIQLVVVYFITANIMLKDTGTVTAHPEENGSQVTEEGADSSTEENMNDEQTDENLVLGKFIYSIDDIIVNPAGTDGKRLFLLSIAFDVSHEEEKKELEEKEVLVKDVVISVLASKTLPQLGNVIYRDTLRNEIIGKLGKVVSDVQINKIYFSKYIIQ